MNINKKHAKLFFLLGIVFCTIFANTAIQNGAFANVEAKWSESVIQKTILMGVRHCIATGKLKDPIYLDDFTNFSEMTQGDELGYIALPSGLTKMGENIISCTNLFDGDEVGSGTDSGEFQGVFALSNKSKYAANPISDPDVKVSLLKDLGYFDASVKSGSEKCMNFAYGDSKDGDSNYVQYTDNVCHIPGIVKVYKTGGDSGYATSSVPHLEVSESGCLIAWVQYGTGNPKEYGSAVCPLDNHGQVVDTDTFFTNVKSMLSKDFPMVGQYYLQLDGASANSYGNAKYTKSNVAMNTATSAFSGSTYDYEGTLKLTDNEKLTYLISALQNWIYADVEVSEYQRCDIEDWSMASSYTQIKYDLSNRKNSDSCGIDTSVGTVSGHDFIYGYHDNGLFDASKATKFYLEEVIQRINDLIDLGATPDKVATENEEVDCYTSGAADNLGWIICPLLSFANDVANDLYKSLIEPALKIEPQMFKVYDGDKNDAYDAWSVFQGFANTIFVIFFLVLIFSQVTGVGIDNYGIKKILPKLIVTAVLVNLSYIICQVCVDLSNIVGNGIQTLFNDLSASWGTSVEVADANITAEVGSTMITAVGIAGAAYLAYITAELWILPLLIALIGVIIAILFLFILLAGRQAIVVLFTVISPLAFVCYLLPNTKKLFDKYVTISKVMLLLYPICSLMVAGGGFVSKLMLSVGAGQGGLFNALTAVMISVVPIFFIPKVVKSSFNALGSMGATISGLGARVSGRVKGGIKNSDAYKNAQQGLKESRTRRRAGIGADGKPVDMTLSQRLLRGSFTNRGIARARAQYNKDQSVRNAEALLMDPYYMENMAAYRQASMSSEREKMYGAVFDRETDRNKIKSELRTALASNDAERASASLSALISKGGIDEALGELNNANWSAMDPGVRSRVVNAMNNSGIDAMKAFSIYKNSGGSGSFSDWAKGTAADKTTAKYGSYAGYLQQKGSGAMNGYGKDEMQFVKSLQNSLSSGMGAGDFGRMVGNASINSNDAQARAEANNIIRQQIGSGAMTAGDLGLSANGVSSMDRDMSNAIVGGYDDYLANKYPGSDLAKVKGAAESMVRDAFRQQINDIKADSTGRFLGKMDPKTRKHLGL